MCFSAPASFLAATVVGAAGIGAAVRAHDRKDLPFAMIPMFFALQQSIEGLLWLTLPVAPESASSTFLTHAFLFFALVFWPLYAPLAAYLIETDPARRRWIAVCVAAGAGVAIYLVWTLSAGTHVARAGEAHIVYELQPYPPRIVGLTYIAATAGATLLASTPTVRLFGAIVLVGSLLAYVAYWEAFLSVWCFFAAAASGVILFHFEKARKMRRAAIGFETAGR